MKKIFGIIILILAFWQINAYAEVYNNTSLIGAKAATKETKTESKSSKNKDELVCDSLIGTSTKTGQIVNDAYKFMRFLVPIILLAMSIKDFGGAIIGQEQDKMKKALKNLYTRLIIAFIILFMPMILKYLFALLGIDTCIL